MHSFSLVYKHLCVYRISLLYDCSSLLYVIELSIKSTENTTCQTSESSVSVDWLHRYIFFLLRYIKRKSYLKVVNARNKNNFFFWFTIQVIFLTGYP